MSKPIERVDLNDPAVRAKHAADEKRAANSAGSFFVDDEPALLVADRSILEVTANCPAQGRFVEAGAVGKGVAAWSGVECHKVFSRAITDYIESGADMRPAELADTVEAYARHSRPDVQADVIAAIRAVFYPWARFIAGGSIHPGNILRYDGGEGKRSGQLAWDYPELGVRLTSEIDLLHAGPSPEVLHEFDWKTGNKIYTLADVHASFQFKLHALLVLHNYPKVQALSVRIWNTRVNRMTWTVEFRRDHDLPEIEAMIRQAASIWKAHRFTEPAKAPTWPTVEKCRICDAAAFCPAATADVKLLATDPGAVVDMLVAAEAQVAALQSLAGAWVEEHKTELVSGAGNAYGYQKPKRVQRAKMATYSVKASVETEATETE